MQARRVKQIGCVGHSQGARVIHRVRGSIHRSRGGYTHVSTSPPRIAKVTMRNAESQSPIYKGGDPADAHALPLTPIGRGEKERKRERESHVREREEEREEERRSE